MHDFRTSHIIGHLENTGALRKQTSKYQDISLYSIKKTALIKKATILLEKSLCFGKLSSSW